MIPASFLERTLLLVIDLGVGAGAMQWKRIIAKNEALSCEVLSSWTRASFANYLTEPRLKQAILFQIGCALQIEVKLG